MEQNAQPKRVGVAAGASTAIMCALGLLWFSSWLTHLPAKPDKALALRLSPVDDVVAPGAAIDVNIEILNRSEKEQKWMERWVEVDIIVEVLDEEGNHVPLTAWGQRVEEMRSRGGGLRAILKTIPPGDRLTYTIRVSRQFDMTLEGKYTLRARYFPAGPEFDPLRAPDATVIVRLDGKRAAREQKK